MKETIRRLPDAELEVMQAIWACEPPVSRTDIEAIVEQTHPMAVTTLLTLLSRLVEKEFLSVAKEGRRSLYTPLVTRHDYLTSQSRRFIDKVCGGSLSAFASALCDSGLKEEELQQLRDLLERGQL
ncbi:BlaI/MecI/CopY family transcriptional regulator [Candidatus Avoscillospira sp. LCP25S3_F1]|uniref:BlaI/MecI/CopY family transcriptional regulator n=1 Tax=Candidatus Avoscillospira sp. LCP25S3_F1 TaxID=3438825 RepID=UPI003F8DEF53